MKSFLDFYAEGKQQYPANIPIKYRMIHFNDQGVICFWQATFLDDFGPWKAGEQYWHVCIDVLNLKISAWKKDVNLMPAGEISFQIKATNQ